MSFYDLPFFPTSANVENGKDGISPSLTVTDISGGHRLTIVDSDGSKTIDIMDGIAGQDGKQGPAGQNGLNATITNATATIDNTSGVPEVKVTLGGTNLERTFAFAFTGLKGTKGDTGAQGIQGIQGEQGLQGERGPQGNPGEPGEKGDTGERGPQGEIGPTGETGPAGKDGKTPIKGTDYFTTEDKSELVNAVITALPKYTGGVS